MLAVRKVLIEVGTIVVMMVGKMGDLKEKRMAGKTVVVEKVFDSVELRVALLAVRKVLIAVGTIDVMMVGKMGDLKETPESVCTPAP